MSKLTEGESILHGHSVAEENLIQPKEPDLVGRPWRFWMSRRIWTTKLGAALDLKSEFCVV